MRWLGFRALRGIRMRPREQRERNRFRISDRRRRKAKSKKKICPKRRGPRRDSNPRGYPGMSKRLDLITKEQEGKNRGEVRATPPALGPGSWQLAATRRHRPQLGAHQCNNHSHNTLRNSQLETPDPRGPEAQTPDPSLALFICCLFGYGYTHTQVVSQIAY
jgi:hypothetical protein